MMVIVNRKRVLLVQRDQNTLCSNLEIAEGDDVVVDEDVDE
jgi:hypothetical protein